MVSKVKILRALNRLESKLFNAPRIRFISHLFAPISSFEIDTEDIRIVKLNENFNTFAEKANFCSEAIKSKTEAKVIGFALELEHEEENALKKLKSKNLDFIILNTANNIDQGFDVDTNQVTIFSRSGEEIKSDIDTKTRIADFIWDNITH